MAEDTFKIDVASFEQSAEYLEQIHQNMAGTTSEANALYLAMQQVAEARAKISGNQSIFSIENIEDVNRAVQDLEKKIVDLGGSQKKLVELRKKEKDLLGSTVLSMDDLTRKQRKYVQEQATQLGRNKTFVRHGQQVIELKDKEQRGQNKIAKAIENQGRQMKGFLSSMSGVQLSLVGIVALIIDAWNQSRKLGAMSRQVAAQWSTGNEYLGASSKQITSIRYGFAKSWEVAGQYVQSLSKAGFSLDQLKRLHEEILALEHLQYGSVQDQVNTIKNLVNEFQKTDAEASNFNIALGLATQQMRGKGGLMISIDEVRQSLGEMLDLQKVYNTDLTGTVALFNTLARKDMAKQLGLGDAPLTVRKEIAKTIAGFSSELEDGWKAALGEGTSAAARVLNFEKLFPEKQFQRMAEFIGEATSQYTGETREIATRQLLKQFGFTGKQVRKVLAESFAQGGLNKDALINTMKTFADARKDVKTIQIEANKKRKELVQQGKSVSRNLKSLQELLKIWVESKLFPLIQKLISSIESMIDIFGTRAQHKQTTTAIAESETARKRLLEIPEAAKAYANIEVEQKKKAIRAFAETARGEKLGGEAIFVAQEREFGSTKTRRQLLKLESEFERTIAEAYESGRIDEVTRAMKFIEQGAADKAVQQLVKLAEDAKRKPVKEAPSGYYKKTAGG